MIDTHCHLDHKQFDNDRTAALERAFSQGLTHLVIPAIEPLRFDGVIHLADSDDRIVCGIGIHPHHASEASDEALARVEELSYHPKVRAIGEIGLDYHYDFAPRAVQQDVFRKQLRLAKQRRLPVIVHNRESDEDLIRILEEEHDGVLTGVLHCFSGTPEQADRAIQLGFCVSFTGNITFKASTLAHTVASVPMDKLMIETDAPYMTPVPHRGKRNEPAFVSLVAEKIATIRNLSLDTVLAATTENARRFFRLGALALVCVVALCSVAFVPFVCAQDDENDDNVSVPFVNPFPKTIGFGGVVGFNTLIDITSKNNESGTFSYRGVALSPGGNVRYYFSDAWAIDAGYYGGYNFTPTIPIPGSPTPPQAFPNKFEAFDFSVHFTTNPGNVLNICFSFGASYLLSTFNAGPESQPQGDLGLTAKIFSIYANILTPLGLFYPGFEWHLNGVLGLNRTKRYDATDERQQLGYVFSVPRLTLYWFPTFPTKK